MQKNKNRIEKLKHALEFFTVPRRENGVQINNREIEVIKMYNEFMNMSFKDQENLKKDWDDYFKAVNSSKARKRWTAQGSAYKKTNYKLASDFGVKAREQTINNDWEVPRPYLEDPQFLLACGYTRSYEGLKRKIQELETGDSDEFTKTVYKELG